MRSTRSSSLARPARLAAALAVASLAACGGGGGGGNNGGGGGGNTPDGTFSPASTPAVASMPASQILFVGDLNGDDDVAIGDDDVGLVRVMISNGLGSAFAQSQQIVCTGIPKAVGAGDVNGDGINDIVISSGTDLDVYLGNSQ